MRLTVFNINDIDLNTYKKSYDRVIGEMGTTVPEGQNTYAAIFNGSILGICSAKENEINCLYVLKLTRHRGIGTYLFTQSVSALLKRYKNVRVSETLYQDRKILQDFINIFDHKDYVFMELNIKGSPNCRTN